MTITDLILPKRGIILPEVPSYIKLDMAFGAGHATQLGDKSRYRSHGTIHGATVADGLHGKCLDFDPNEPSYVEIPASHTQLDFTSEDFSLVMRIKPDVVDADQYLLTRGKANDDGYLVKLDPLERFDFLSCQTDAYQRQGGINGSLSAGTWYTVGLSRSGKTVVLYADGVDTTGLHKDIIDNLTSAKKTIIGAYNDAGASPFDGKIEFLRIFGGVALLASEHLAYHNALK